MIACTSREGKLVSYLLRLATGAEISGMCTTDKWFEIVQDATPSGTVEVTQRTFEGAS